MNLSVAADEITEPYYDVVAIEIASPHKERTLVSHLTYQNAVAARDFAIVRRGNEKEFYRIVPHKAPE
jgi:BarA-like signal transduction histidine kinase